MAKAKLTAGRIAAFNCNASKAQAFLWCNETPGLGVRATPNSTKKSYIFQSKVNGQTIRITMGQVKSWSIEQAQVEARRLQVQIDNGDDPRQVKADDEAAKVAAKQAKEAEAAALAYKQTIEAVTAGEAWQAYVADRSASFVDGKPEWGEKHRAQHEYFVQAGGVKRTRGRRPNEPETTRPGILVPLMNMRLIDLDAKAVASWLEKEAAQAPAATALAFRHLRAFLTWCTKNDKYKSATHSDACQSDDVKNKVPTPKTKKNDSLRRAQIRPWFEAVQKVGNPVIAAYLQCLLLTGARRNELAALRWQDVDFKWKSLALRDKVEGERTIPLTPYVEYLISSLPRRNEFVFSSPAAASGRLEEPRILHNKALAAAALPALSLHGLRRSFSSLSEWVEVPAGIAAQIMGHKPSAIAEKHYIQRELDLLHLWHVKIEAWILAQAEIEFVTVQPGLRIVGTSMNSKIFGGL
ncbi:MAG: integrase family protein [Methylococcaceae bacterium]|jgi:integrase